jgi:hypothetical protein
MSDDEVLNLHGWGLPDRIDRERQGKVYRETWTYRRGDGLRWLHFTNARLTGMESGEAAPDGVIGFGAAWR